MLVELGADRLAPDRPIGCNAAIILGHRPGTRQRVVDRGDFVVQQVRIGLVAVDLLLDDGLIVLVKWKAVGVVGARALQAAGLDLEHVVMTSAALVDPFADGIAREGRLDLGRPVASVGINSAIVVDVIDQDIGDVGRDDDLHRFIDVHHARHARSEAVVSRVIALFAFGLRGHVGLVNSPVFRRQWD